RIRGVMMYKMLPPSRLLADAQERERVAKDVIEELRTFHRISVNQEIIVYEGIDEFRKHVLRSYSVTKSGGMLRYLSVSPEWHSITGPSLEKDVTQLQKEKKIRARGIAKRWFPEIRAYMKHTKGLTEMRVNPLISSDTNNVEILADRICIQ